MKKTLGLLLLVLCGLPALAQAQTVTPANKFVLDEAAPDLATAQGYTYKVYADGATSGVVVPMTCVGTASPFTCSTPVGAFTPGAHSVTVTAGNVAGESPKSAALTFQMVLVPSAPQNLRIQ